MSDPNFLSHVIASFQSFLQSDKLNDLEQAIGEIGTIASGIKKVNSVREWHLVRKIVAFSNKANELGFDAKAYQKLEDKYGKDKVLELIVIAIDRLNNVEKAELLAWLMKALENDELNWDEFKSLSFALEQLNPLALQAEVKFANGIEGELFSSSTPFLIAVGLASAYSKDQPFTWSGSTGGTHFSVSPLGMKLVKYGIWPYQQDLKTVKS